MGVSGSSRRGHRMRLLRLCVSCVVVCFAVTLVAQRSTDPLAAQTWKLAGVERSALVSGPTSAVPAKGSPLVFVFHGHGGTAAHSARTFAIHTHWPEAVVLYAQGLPTRGLMSDPEGRRPGWQHRVEEHSDAGRHPGTEQGSRRRRHPRQRRDGHSPRPLQGRQTLVLSRTG